MGISAGERFKGSRRARSEGITFTEEPGEIRVGVVNLMPFKDEVEYQFFSVLGRYDRSVEVEFLYPSTHTSKNSSMEYIRENYHPLSSISSRGYDGIIVTGAPVEELPFEEVDYWEELDSFFSHNRIPSIYICWGAQGALYSKYNIKKHSLDRKLFGVYEHQSYSNPFIRGSFLAPHSRNTYNRRECIEEAGLKILSHSQEAGVYICSSGNYREIFISGHGEYQRERLRYEYERDGRSIPENYFPGDDPLREPPITWDRHREEFYKNWLDFIKE